MVNELKNQKTYRPEMLITFTSELLMKVGVPEEQSQTIADSLIQANLNGTDSHGLLRLPIYIKRMEKGLVKANTAFKIEKETATTALIDGQDGMGQVLGKIAMEIATEKAEQNQIASVAVKNSNHFGTAAQYATLAAQKGMIGIVMSNAPTLMPPLGGAEPKLGNNPISLAVPSPMEYPVILDMALSQAAYGKIQLAHHNRQPIPPDWGVDSKGNPTTDPGEVIQSRMLSPAAGPKGYGLAFFVDILCGVLTNSVFGSGVKSLFNLDEPMRCSHFFITINPEAFLPRDVFNEKLREMILYIKNTQLAEGTQEILIPGEIEYRVSREREEKGIPLDDETLSELLKLSKRYHVDFER